MFGIFKKKERPIDKIPHGIASIQMCEMVSHKIAALRELGNQKEANELYSRAIKFIYGAKSKPLSNEELNIFDYRLAYHTIPELLFSEDGTDEFWSKKESLGTMFNLFLLIYCAQDEIKNMPMNYHNKFTVMMAPGSPFQSRPAGKPYYLFTSFPDREPSPQKIIDTMSPGALRTRKFFIVDDRKNKSARYFILSDSTAGTFSVREVSREGNAKVCEVDQENQFFGKVRDIVGGL